MKLSTFGFLMCLIGLGGGIVAYLSGMVYKEITYFQMGLLANAIQGVGLVFIYGDTN